MVIALFATGCISITPSPKSEASTIEVTPTSIVNLRTGPGTDYNIIKGVYPGTKLTTNSPISDEWIMVYTEDGIKAYVASKYVKVVSSGVKSTDSNTVHDSSNSNKSQANLGVNNSDSNISKAYTSHSLNLRKDNSFLSKYMTAMISGGGQVITVILLVLDIAVIWYFRKKYDYTCIVELTPATPAIIVILISLGLTIFQSIAILVMREKPGYLDPYYILMILSTGMVMVDVPWRLRISGRTLHDQYLSNKGNQRAEWATKLGNVTWTILLIPISILYIQYAGYADHKIFTNASLWSMIFDMIIFTIGAYSFCGIIWPYIVVKYLLTSINSKILWALNIVLVIGIVRYQYNVCEVCFSGFNYLASLFLLILSVSAYITPLFKTVNEKRCSNCHSFYGEHTHTTDLGYSDYTSKEWKNDDASGITPNHRNAVISDNQRLVSTTKRTSKWTTHHQCPFCDHQWKIDNQSTETIDSHTVKRSWKETYLD